MAGKFSDDYRVLGCTCKEPIAGLTEQAFSAWLDAAAAHKATWVSSDRFKIVRPP